MSKFTSLLLCVTGYSSCSRGNDEEEEEEESRSENIREHHVEEVMKMLRAISLRHNPTTMATFLQETVLEKLVEALSLSVGHQRNISTNGTFTGYSENSKN